MGNSDRSSSSLVFESISAEVGGRVVLRDVSFAVNARQPVGLVGPNGSGKTTLLLVAAGLLAPSSGRVVAPGLEIGYLPQARDDRLGEPVANLFPGVFGATFESELAAVSAELSRHEPGSAEAPDLAHRYDALLGRVSAIAAAAFDLEDARRALGLREVTPDTVAGTLSGGELAKLGLLELFARNPEVLLLDEPTNHLDLAGSAWLEEQVASFPGAVLIVSHDRALLDAVATSVAEVDPRTQKIEVFAGGYTEYAMEKARRYDALWEAYRRQQREEKRLKRVISAIESRSRSIENSTIDFYVRKRAAKVARRAVTLKARVQRQAESAGRVERPWKAVQSFSGQFQAHDGGASTLVSLVDVSLEVAGRRLIESANAELRRGEQVVLVGPNGSGKTTLFRAIIGEHPAGGEVRVSGSARVGYLPQEETLSAEEAAMTPIPYLRRVRPMTEAEAGNMLHRFLLAHENLGTPLGRLSYGERRRLALARLVLGGANLLLLDEPTNHLDLPSREAFEAAFASFEGAALVVTHDRYFIERFADRILLIEDGRLVEVGAGAR